MTAVCAVSPYARVCAVCSGSFVFLRIGFDREMWSWFGHDVSQRIGFETCSCQTRFHSESGSEVGLALGLEVLLAKDRTQEIHWVFTHRIFLYEMC